MSTEKPVKKPADKEEGDTRAKAFERAYSESHPGGPYPEVELKPKPEQHS